MIKLIVGLGNPGNNYIKTPHNLGFRVVEELGNNIKTEASIWEENKKFTAQLLKINAANLILVKPLTFMNLSGEAVKKVVDYYHIAPQDVVVVHDELDLPLGKIKLQLGGSAAGHHGIESVIESLGTNEFYRVRLGVGLTDTEIASEDYILKPLEGSEDTAAEKMVHQAVEAIKLLLSSGLAISQNKYH